MTLEFPETFLYDKDTSLPLSLNKKNTQKIFL